MFLVLATVPLALIIYILSKLMDGQLYPRLGDKLNLILASIYIGICLIAIIYLRHEFLNLIYYRAGSFNIWDKLIGISFLVVLMEFSRREHPILFYLNLGLMFYCVYGWIFPGFAFHPGVSWERVLLSSSVEIKLGAFGDYAQIGSSTISAFLLMLGIAMGFGIQGSMVRVIMHALSKRRYLIPQTAVLSSMATATSSGSGAANVAITGQFTIPLMKRLGIDPVFAGAVEASASLGGLIMPPVMAIAAFIMAEFLGVSYWEVVARGYAPALIYYITIALAVYLISLRYLGAGRFELDLSQIVGKIGILDRLNTFLFFSHLAMLICLMGIWLWTPISAAFMVALILLVTASVISLSFTQETRIGSWIKSLAESLKQYGIICMEIILLLSILGVMINLFTVSGWILKIGMLMMELGGANLGALIGTAFGLGIFLGLGLPPSATYVLAAILIVPAMMMFGIDPWVAHFFAFFLGVISEYSPPTSLTAAVAARISGASFTQVMFRTLTISLPVFVLCFSIFNWEELVTQPGISQLQALGAVMLGCLGITCAIYGRFSSSKIPDLCLRLVCGSIALFALFHPRTLHSMLLFIPVAILVVWGIVRTQKLTMMAR